MQKFKVASWNVNSINVRINQVIDVIKRYDLDILGVQETKSTDQVFPIHVISDAGFFVWFNGQKSYNGTCIISKKPLEKPLHRLPFLGLDYQRRFLQANYNDIIVINCYVPNGKEVGDEKYYYKLKWLEALYQHIRATLKKYPKVILMGDFNIAPDDRDVYDPIEWRDKILCSPSERKIFNDILELGMSDSFRLFNQEGQQFSWWDYREGGYQRNKGHRIDFILVSDALKNSCVSSIIEKDPRQWERPSDHAPVMASFDLKS